ncbi:MAG: aminopeptidase N [Algicola sp.]|nr:aminopeptidase N [Algicola sp.]
MFKKTTALILFSLATIGCTNQSTVHVAPVTTVASQPARVVQDWLSDSHAQLRKRQVSDVSYQLDFDLSQTGKFYGSATIEFNNHLLSDDLTFDFSHGKVEQVWVNGQEVDFAYNDYFITVPKSSLKLGKTAVKIKYSHKYSDNGSGLYRYTDGIDNKSYLYTHFEPYEANKLFPSFDQPNLRASYKVKVTAPSDWTVITSVRESEVVDKGALKQWHFPESARFSTYIFPLHAGPYHVWHDSFTSSAEGSFKGSAEDASEDIPLRLFARESLAEYVDVQHWMNVTKKGLGFFNDYFDYRYPFGKYDQIIVPDFNISGMETVAAGTYSESTVSRGKVTKEGKERVSGLLLHEMSHMWFGDLITIDWWSNLWLKESFATYMSNVALGETGLSDNAWNKFYITTKQRAYGADSSVTTHAIQMPVSDTKNGVASFDTITYQKGASVLNQLAHFLGAEPFKAGIRQYFKDFDYQATKLPDFMGTLGKVAGRDLDKWTQDWLYKAGTNRVRAVYQCQNDKISQFALAQSYPKDHPYLREHALNIGLYSLGKELKVINTQTVRLSGKTTQVPELIGSQCPDMVYPNHGDWGFVKVILDDKTRNNVVRAIPLIKDSMVRAMFYQSLWDLVDDKQMSLTTYIDLVTATIQDEKDTKVLGLVMNHMGGARSYLDRFKIGQYPSKNDYLSKLEHFSWQGLNAQTAGTDHQKIWFYSALNASHSSQALNKLNALLEGQKSIDGLDIDQDMRWDLLIHLSGYGYQHLDDLLAKEKAKDPSYQGELAAIAADARQPKAEAKLRWIEEFEKTSGRLTARKQKVAMDYMFPSNQGHLLEPLADRLLSDLVSFDVDRDQKLIATMVYTIMPRLCSNASVAKLQQAIDNNPQLGLIASKGLKEMHQGDEKCVAISKVK